MKVQSYPGYPVFKGLQKPIEFMGLRGRFIYLAATAIGGAFFSFIIVNLFFGTVPGFVTSFLIGGVLLGLLFYKQRQGLYARKRFRGIVIYQRLFVNHRI